MADNKSAKSNAAGKPAARPTAAPRLVERKARSDAAKVKTPAPKSAKDPAQDDQNPKLSLLADPERIGQMLSDRPAWVDEIGAIIIIVIGIIGFFSLLNATTSATMIAGLTEFI